MSKVKIIKKGLTGFDGDAWLVKKGSEYFVVSNTIVMFSGQETLVFPSNKEGEVTDWLEVAGGRGVTNEEAIEELENLEI